MQKNQLTEKLVSARLLTVVAWVFVSRLKNKQ